MLSSKTTWVAVAALVALGFASETRAQTVATPGEMIAAGKPILEVRARFEAVDQDGPLAEGQAITVRTHLGWETAKWSGFSGLVELENVSHLGPEHFAVNVPGATSPPLNGASKARYPIINDPDVTELNRAQIMWTPTAAAGFTVGRQRILIDDQRFIGNVGWRQDEQTFDGARADLAHGRFKVSYAYISRVNRILGQERDWNSDSHLVNVAWTANAALQLEGFVYALDFSNSPINSSITKGLKVSGKTKLGGYGVSYDATWANQTDWRGRTAPFNLDYKAASVAATYDIYTVRVGYEALEGNGTRGFTTPLATTHGFQGWADAWVSPGGNKSFVDGIDDLNLTLDLRPHVAWAPNSKPTFTVRYHDFNDQRTGADLAHEWDLQATTAVTPKLSIGLKYADFRRETSVPLGTAAPPASRTKVWLTFEYKL